MEAKMQKDSRSPDRWFRRFGTSGEARQRLICFHHAGGGPSLFREWHKYVPPETEVWAAALPGREARIAEKPLDQLRVLAGLLLENLPLDLPFAFFGHSLGSLVGFELARQLHERGLAVPQHLFVSACSAPHQCRRDKSRATLSDAELFRLMEVFGGTPKEILRHPEYLEMVFSILRADFNLIDDYFVPDGCSLRLPITAYGGSGDIHVRPEKILAWDLWASNEFSCQWFDGDHFYLTTHREALIADLIGRWKNNHASRIRSAHA